MKYKTVNVTPEVHAKMLELKNYHKVKMIELVTALVEREYEILKKEPTTNDNA